MKFKKYKSSQSLVSWEGNYNERERQRTEEGEMEERKKDVCVWTGNTIIQRNVTLDNFVIDHIYINLDSIAYYIPSNRNKHI